ncbi:uncharacterized protein GIQ15_06286 [Arthroderma uncinatum]|uniref:uncharacterized protein n=1 Tax=Arthroderma uncinatum TaxID=74035 RepID=UPI00144A8E96|nr:uncharacterized protein GIQ15_06286 [Arthroderma uncinatum]KAF3480939.1 hypothetical protein GIQ15_06286 [Arthroderma uncinatum]
MSLSSQCVAAGAAGLIAHHAIFKEGEWHMKAPVLTKYYFSIIVAVILGEVIYDAYRDIPIAWRGAILLVTFTVSLFSSIIFYRIFLHRDRHFPGPFLAGVTKLWHTFHSISAQNHLVLEKLHRQYGDFVRTGPAEITIFHPEAIAKFDGPGNKCSKSVWYDFLLPHVGVNTIRNKPFHDQRRRIWTKGLSTNEIGIYESRIASQVKELDEIISDMATRQEPVDFLKYSYFFSFDVMGLFVFSRSFDMLHKNEWHYSISMMRKAMKFLGPVSSVPWLGQIGLKLLKGYWVIKDWHAMIKWCENRMAEYVQKDQTTHDIASWLVADSKKRNAVEEDHHLLTGDSIVAIIAGSDTVAPTMVFLFYELLRHPEQVEKLYQELKTVDVMDTRVLQGLPHLNAVIKETLRLHPAVPTGGYRDTPPEGMAIGGTFIPGNTTMVAPRYVLHRLESCYIHAGKWIPERWTTSPELVKDTRSFLPFSQGY